VAELFNEIGKPVDASQQARNREDFSLFVRITD
jgi:hypothetical protein